MISINFDLILGPQESIFFLIFLFDCRGLFKGVGRIINSINKFQTSDL